MTRIIAFTGPTISAFRARKILDADYRAPAKAGDVLLATQFHPQAIVIIDGVFECVPSIWHKEILFALSEGIHVYGGSSMGALRAAELHTFGMVGVGKIFEDYCTGALEDDDEVAVAHGPLDEGSNAHSEAMVNVREGLRLAAAALVISGPTQERLAVIGKALHFTDRSWPVILRAGAHEGLPAVELAGLRSFLETVDTNLKRQDAIQLLQRVAVDTRNGLSPFKPAFKFEHTSFFEVLWNSVHPAPEDPENLHSEDLPRFPNFAKNGGVRRNSFLLSLAMAEGQRRGIDLTLAEIRNHARAFFAAQGLQSKQQIEKWLDQNRLSLREFRQLIRLEAWVERLAKEVDAGR